MDKPSNYATDITRNHAAWDTAVEAAGGSLCGFGWGIEGAKLVGCERPPGPYKYAMPSCRSGGHDYCTCDGCF